MTGAGGPGAAAGAWARTDIKTRVRALLALGVIAGVTAGVALASFAGARRTDTAFARLRARTHASDAAVFSSQVGQFHPDWSKLRPEVAQLASWSLIFGIDPTSPGESTLFAPTDRQWFETMDRPIVIRGRMFNPAADDEMVIDEETAKQYHAHIGSTEDFHAFRDITNESTGTPTGAQLHLRVVGIVRVAPFFTFTSAAVVSPGVIAKHGNEIEWIENAFVRLRDGSADIPALQHDADAAIAPGTPLLDLRATQRRVDTTTSVEQSALWLLGLAVAIAGLVLVGQMLGRSATSVRRDVPALRAIGMTRSNIAGAVTRVHAVPAAIAMVFAFATAVIASRWFPVGLGSRIDPDRGMHVDWSVLAPGVIVVGGLFVAASALLGYRTASLRAQGRAPVPSRFVSLVRRRAPVSVGLGTAMAFERADSERAPGVRPALIAAIVGVVGVVGALTIERGINDSLAHPERAGVTWDATLQPQQSQYQGTGFKADFEGDVRADSHVAVATIVERLLLPVDKVGVPAFTIRPRAEDRDAITFTRVSGPVPTTGSVSMGPATARQLHVNVGDTVFVGTGSRARELRITGRALFPQDVHAEFDEGIWLAATDYDAIAPPRDPEVSPRELAVRFRPGVSTDEGLGSVGKAVGDRLAGAGPVDVPPELANLRQVKSVPIVLAIFLALLAMAALLYVLVASVRARARDFAVLRAIGLTRGTTRMVCSVQGTSVAVIGVVIGVPLGIVVGRSAWTLISDRVPLEDVPPTALVAALLVVPAVFLVANAIAWGPGRRAARVRPAEVLRAE